MQQLFELNIFKPYGPTKVRLTNEFEEQCSTISRHYHTWGEIPNIWRYTNSCVYTYFRDVLHRQVDSDEDHNLINDISATIINLHEAGLIDHTSETKIEAQVSK